MTVSETEMRKKAAISGALLGVITMVLGIFSFYYITGITSSPWMVSFGPLIFSVTIPIVIAVLFSIDLRKKIGGYWKFKQAVSGFFVMFMASYIINYIGSNLIFAKVIEPHMVQKTQEAVKKASAEIMEKQGLDQEKIDEQMENIQKKFDEQTENSVKQMITSFGISLLFIFIISLIFGAIFKKDPPLYDTAALEHGDATV